MTDAITNVESWLTDLGLTAVEITPLSGDVSLRRYFHLALADGATAIAVHYPERMKEVCERFRIATDLLAGAGIPVPGILATACERGFMLVEDLGSRSFYDLAGEEWESLVPLYRQALSFIGRLQSLPVDAVVDLNPPLDGSLLRHELEISWTALNGFPGFSAPADLLGRLRDSLAAVALHLEDCPLVPCHRDFMARNLMLRDPDRSLTVIDHQDLRLGPAAYDLASLLNDSLFPPPAVERKLRSVSIDGGEALLLYRRCAVQRTVKAAGTFARFAARGDRRHLDLIPTTLERAVHHLRRLPEAGDYLDDLAASWRSKRAVS